MRVIFFAAFVSIVNSTLWAQGQQVQPPVVDSMAYYNNTKKLAFGDPKFVEYAPTIQADGKTIIYQSNEGRKYDLYEKHKENTEWGKSIALDKINKTTDSTDLIGGPSISFD